MGFETKCPVMQYANNLKEAYKQNFLYIWLTTQIINSRFAKMVKQIVKCSKNQDIEIKKAARAK